MLAAVSLISDLCVDVVRLRHCGCMRKRLECCVQSNKTGILETADPNLGMSIASVISVSTNSI